MRGVRTELEERGLISGRKLGGRCFLVRVFVESSVERGHGSGPGRVRITGEEGGFPRIGNASYRSEYGRDVFSAIWSLGVGGGSGLM